MSVKSEDSRSKSRPSLCVVGMGYIGLPTALVFTEQLPNVVGVDTSPTKVASLREAESPILENGVQDKLSTAVKSGRLKFSTEIVSAENYIIAVPTPLNEDNTVNMGFVETVVDSIAPVLHGDELIIIESTSPPGTTARMRERLMKLRPDLEFEGSDRPTVNLAYCPERVLPGAILEELRTNSRIVGGDSPSAIARASQLYSKIAASEILETDTKTAELTKLAENAFRDVNIAFANEISMVADAIGSDSSEVIRLANRHPRVNVLQPGPGVGGHCIAVDPWFIVEAAPEHARVIQAARRANDAKTDWVVEKILEDVEDQGWSELNVIGLTFKADVDDLRLSPSIRAVHQLASRAPQLTIYIYDPYVEEVPDELGALPNIKFCVARADLAPQSVTAFLVPHKDEVDRLTSNPDEKILDFTGTLNRKR